MKKIIFIFTLCFMFCSTHIYAARFGGGKSFGQQKSSHSSHSSEKPQQNSQQQQQHPQQQPHNSPAPTPPKSSFASKVLPALAGLSAGALLGSLLSGHGLGGLASGLSSMLMMLAVGGIAFYVIKKLISSKSSSKNLNTFHNTATAAHTDAGQMTLGNNYQAPIQAPIQNTFQHPNNYYNLNHHSLPFNKEEFIRTAKITFIRMQNAYDAKNLADIRNFTTPEVFGEIQMQIQERGNAVNQTEVIHINASILDVDDVNNMSANVFFSGQIREQQNSPPIEINEIWHFVKHDQNNWLIAGIEQKK